LIILLAVLVLGVTGKMVSGLVLSPSNRLKPAEIYRREEITRAVPKASLRKLNLPPPRPWSAPALTGERALATLAVGKLPPAPFFAHSMSGNSPLEKKARVVTARATVRQHLLPTADHERNNSPPGTAARTTA
jgi:hypothetical protein